jgi:hypothetical protein
MMLFFVFFSCDETILYLESAPAVCGRCDAVNFPEKGRARIACRLVGPIIESTKYAIIYFLGEM